LKALDPAVGSGHFLVVLFDLLVALYREEAKHRGEEGQERWSTRAIVESIVENNLHGIDLDPRAVQIAAAAIWLKAKQTCPEAEPARLNLVASNLRLASLSDDDPAIVELRREVERETGIPAQLTDTIVHALRGADHLGSLLKIDTAVDEAIRKHEAAFGRVAEPVQGRLFGDAPPSQQRLTLDRDAARANILERLEGFLAGHSSGDDLGLRLRGEQLAAGVRFVRMLREGAYDLVVGNPPYQGTSKMQDAAYVARNYPRGKADLFAAFLERGMQFASVGGTSALLTLRSWMFIQQYKELRYWLLESFTLRALGDFDRGAFEEVPDEVVSVVVSVFRRMVMELKESVALQPTPLNDRSRDSERTQRKRAATLCAAAQYPFSISNIRAVAGEPLVYWWQKSLFDVSRNSLTVGESSKIRQGLATGNDPRYLLRPWEPLSHDYTTLMLPLDREMRVSLSWVPYIKGAAGKKWFEPLDFIIRWKNIGLDKKVNHEFLGSRGGNGTPSERDYFSGGVVFCTIGNDFGGRKHRFASIFASTGCTVFGNNANNLCCLFNTQVAQQILTSFNPTVHFTNNDVERMPLLQVGGADRILAILESAFFVHESHREPSVEFTSPGPSPWRRAQEWAQVAVDRSVGSPLPPHEPEYDPEPPTDHLSYALGVALGRFGPNGEGILDPLKADHRHALPAGILFLDGSLETNDLRDGLGHDAAKPLHAACGEHGRAIDERSGLRDYLRTKFFEDVHRKMYESRPIHWPLSSKERTFVAWVTIHRWNEGTLRVLLADHLAEALKRLDGEIADLRAVRDGADKKKAREAEKRFAKVQKWREELVAFIAAVEQCAERGPLPTDAACPPREANARYNPDLDDGVMINSAALWPLLLPQWKEPKKWWKELASAQGKKDYDWSHLAMRYWPTRVDEKCQSDPSLGVAHGCFWKYHPARAWAWELRLQDEIGPKFRIEEASYRRDGGHQAHRAAFLVDQAEEALAAIEKEALRRRKKQKTPLAEFRILEPGLWSRHPEACYALELRLIEKQGADFLLLSPDEPATRAAYEAEHSEQVDRRRKLLESVTVHEMFPAEDEDEEAGDDEDLSDEAMDDVGEVEVTT